jgi:hypothetical protein
MSKLCLGHPGRGRREGGSGSGVRVGGRKAPISPSYPLILDYNIEGRLLPINCIDRHYQSI